MTEFNFWESLTIVVIPILVGGVLTHRLSHSWQSYRYKIDIKKQLMNAFHEYAYTSHYKHELFMREFFEKYSTNEGLDELLTTGNIRHKFKFPEEPKEFPAILLKTQYEEFLATLSESYKLRTNLGSLLRLYSDSNKLIEDLETISRYNGYIFALIKKIVRLEKVEEFTALYDKYYKKNQENEELVISFEKKLSNLKLRKIPV